MRKVIIPMEFEIGDLEEIGLGGFKMTWVEAERGEGKSQRTYNLTTGAGLGNGRMEASATGRGQFTVYAKASVRDLASKLFAEMDTDLDKTLVCPQCGADMNIDPSGLALPVCSGLCGWVGEPTGKPCDTCGKYRHEHELGDAEGGHNWHHSFGSERKPRKIRKVVGPSEPNS